MRCEKKEKTKTQEIKNLARKRVYTEYATTKSDIYSHSFRREDDLSSSSSSSSPSPSPSPSKLHILDSNNNNNNNNSKTLLTSYIRIVRFLPDINNLDIKLEKKKNININNNNNININIDMDIVEDELEWYQPRYGILHELDMEIEQGMNIATLPLDIDIYNLMNHYNNNMEKWNIMYKTLPWYKIKKLLSPIMPYDIWSVDYSLSSSLSSEYHKDNIIPILYLKPRSSICHPFDSISISIPIDNNRNMDIDPKNEEEDIIKDEYKKNINNNNNNNNDNNHHANVQCQLAIIIGKCGKNIEPSIANEYIYGFSCANTIKFQEYNKNEHIPTPNEYIDIIRSSTSIGPILLLNNHSHIYKEMCLHGYDEQLERESIEIEKEKYEEEDKEDKEEDKEIGEKKRRDILSITMQIYNKNKNQLQSLSSSNKNKNKNKNNINSNIKYPMTIAEIISFVSQSTTLYPGTVILIPTPIDIGQVYHQNQVKIQIDRLGELINDVLFVTTPSFESL